jgi:hypothetical protein
VSALLSLIADLPDGERAFEARVDQLVIAGWTGRDPAAVQAHIRELEALGVRPPRTTPIFYRAASSLLTTQAAIQVSGDASTGEAEAVLLILPDGEWIGLGSDHTDRELEKTGVTISKQACAKPLGRHVWPYAIVAGHWDSLILRSFAVAGSERRLYQEAPVSQLRHPKDLQSAGGAVATGTAMFCGTVPVKGEIGWADQLELELEDPIRRCKLTHRYAICALPIEG